MASWRCIYISTFQLQVLLHPISRRVDEKLFNNLHGYTKNRTTEHGAGRDFIERTLHPSEQKREPASWRPRPHSSHSVSAPGFFPFPDMLRSSRKTVEEADLGDDGFVARSWRYKASSQQVT